MDLSTTVHLVNNTLFELKLSAKALKWGYWDTFPQPAAAPEGSFIENEAESKEPIEEGGPESQ
jgi:hypothetical protein